MSNKVEKLVQQFAQVPGIEETGPREGWNSPVMRRIQRRTRIIYAVMVLAGLLTAILYFSGVKSPPKLVGMAAGLIVPGGGFMASGNVVGILAGIAVAILWWKVGFKLLDMAGAIVGVFGIWIIGILGGLMVREPVAVWQILICVLAAAILFGYFEYRTWKLHQSFIRTRSENIAHLDEALKTYDEFHEAAVQKKEAEAAAGVQRELEAEAIPAMRYIFNTTVREKGDFSPLDNGLMFDSLATYRYQFSSLGYTLMTYQKIYAPNFHGYLTKAFDYCIDGLTDLRTCGYWRFESLCGYLKYNTDPVNDSNIMLSGWMMPPMTSYGAVSGDRRYEEDGALQFHGSKKAVHAYNVKECVELLYRQWKGEVRKFPGYLIPCEPNVAFPICNSYGLLGLLIYDRDHGTTYSEEVLPDFYKHLTEDFTEINGVSAPRRQYLFGLRFMPDTQLMDIPFNDATIAMEYAPIFPGLAKRGYAMLRQNVLELNDEGVAFIKGIPWEAFSDIGTKAKNPASMISLMEMVAAEHGDYEMLKGLQKAEERYLEKSMDPKALYYKEVSVVNMANIAYAKIAGVGDWYDTILKDAPESAKEGPVLMECSYPEVIVAKAASGGDDLNMVLYNGTQPGEQKLGLARLKPGQRYTLSVCTAEKEQPEISEFTADHEGLAEVSVYLEDRTEVLVKPI